ncbi:hypothetical protein UJ101_00978 [Flavobacteriaceae bacterium UJ101]|nr:hypothetical protein UJ101_00978 [Flavobacteriaceae bacterium UJ101]
MKERILQKIESHRGLTFENIIGDSFELFKKVFAYGMLKVVFEGILMYTLQIALMIPFFALIGMDSQNFVNSGEMDVFASVLMILIYFGIIFLSTFFSFTLSVGFYRICFQQESGLNVNVEAFFYALKKKYWVKTFVLSILISLLLVVAFLLFVIPFIYAIIPIGFVAVVYAFNIELSIQDIFNIAFKLGNKYWLVLFLSCVAAFFISMLGIFACFIGIIATQTFIYMPFYTAYSKVVGFDTEIADEIDLIGENKE